MNIRKIILLVFSLIFALVLAYLVYNLLSTVSGEEIAIEIEYIEVLVANNDINEADIIENTDVRFIKLPKDLNISEYFTDKSLVVGRYAAEKIYTGEYIHSSRVIDDYSDKLARDIEYDKRAVAIYTDQYSAVADLLKPGDRVDLYVFIPEKTSGTEIIHPDISKLLIQNIKVLSIDQDTIGETLPREETPDRYAITLEAYYKDVEQIVLAENIGYLKIALRPLGDDTIYIT
ncbi:MAG: Flp pilus assembly protein CpaB, partial [Acidaminobacteraceae bacterium]